MRAGVSQRYANWLWFSDFSCGLLAPLSFDLLPLLLC